MRELNDNLISKIFNLYPFIEEKHKKLINSLPPLFLHDVANVLLVDNITNPDLLHLNDKDLTSLILFNTLLIHIINEDNMRNMRESCRDKLVALKFRKQLFQYAKDNNIDLDTLKNTLFKILELEKVESSLWESDLKFVFHAYICDAIEDGTFDLSIIKSKRVRVKR